MPPEIVPLTAGGRALKGLGSVRGALTTAAGVLTAVLGAVFLVAPNWRPLPRDKIGATVTVKTWEGGVGVEDWAERQYPGRGPQALRELLGTRDLGTVKDSTGLVLYVVVQTEGFKRRSLQLRTRVYKGSTASLDPALNAQTILPQAGKLSIDAPSRSSVQVMLVDDLTLLEGRFIVRVEAYDEGGILAYDDSAVIPGS